VWEELPSRLLLYLLPVLPLLLLSWLLWCWVWEELPLCLLPVPSLLFLLPVLPLLLLLWLLWCLLEQLQLCICFFRDAYLLWVGVSMENGMRLRTLKRQWLCLLIKPASKGVSP
jgi:hypothetical protein